MGVVYSVGPNSEDDFDYEDEHVELESDKKEYGDDGSFEEDDDSILSRIAKSDETAKPRDVSITEAALLVREQEERHEAAAETAPKKREISGNAKSAEKAGSTSRAAVSVSKKSGVSKKASAKKVAQPVATKKAKKKTPLKKQRAKKK